MIKSDVVIIGGGLAGLMAAIRLGEAGVHTVLVDSSLPEASGDLGGFAAFSGAKFSLPPAGQGLIPVAGSSSKLEDAIKAVIEVLGIDGANTNLSYDLPGQNNENQALKDGYRKYDSILLTPHGIRDLIERLRVKCKDYCKFITGKAENLNKVGSDWQVLIQDSDGEPSILVGNAIFHAAGRMASKMLVEAGAAKTPGKGLDVGFRVEMLDKEGLSRLRALGPDAKILLGGCRTFCLNSPGEIFRYPYEEISIPGGVVADPSVASANVGLLLRVDNKEKELLRIKEKCKTHYEDLLSISERVKRGRPFGKEKRLVEEIFGTSIAHRLEVFCQKLEDINMIDWTFEHRLHFPLLDWHWPTFALQGSHKTSLDDIYAIGDSSGHARGLLQAAISGWIGAEEYLNE